MSALRDIVTVQIEDGEGRLYEVACYYEPGEPPRLWGHPDDRTPGSGPTIDWCRGWLLDESGERVHEVGEADVHVESHVIYDAICAAVEATDRDDALDAAAMRADMED